MPDPISPSRRAFVRFLAGSPLLSLLGFPSCTGGESGAESADSTRALAAPPGSPDDVINVLDFQPLAEAALPPAHYGYLATGVDGDETLHANREGFDRFDLRPRRLVDVSDIDSTRYKGGCRAES